METANKVTHLILNSPYKAPKAYWLYEIETKKLNKKRVFPRSSG